MVNDTVYFGSAVGFILSYTGVYSFFWVFGRCLALASGVCSRLPVPCFLPGCGSEAFSESPVASTLLGKGELLWKANYVK